MQSTSKLHLTMTEGKVSDFSQLMQRGLGVRGEVGGNVWTFLTQRLGLSASTVEEKISTVFLDGKPVDDLHSAVVKDGSVLALSGAMPGLLGATMRRAGFYASLRSQISHRAEACPVPIKEGLVVLKLFNVIAAEAGGSILESGVWVRREDLADFLRSRPADFWGRCRPAECNGRVVEAEELRRMDWGKESELVCFRVCVGLGIGQD